MAGSFQLNRSNTGNSIHQQLVDGLSAEFSLLPPGSPLPGAKALQKRFGVAYMTITRALDELVMRNEIVRFRGRGSFTASNRVRTVYYLQVAPEHIKPYVSHELEGAYEQAQCSGIKIQNFPIASYDTIGHVDWELMRKLPERASVIMYSVSNFHSVLDFLHERKCQVLVCNDQTDRICFESGRISNCHQVIRNRHMQCRRAVEILANAGCKNILLIHEGPSVFNPVRKGYCCGLQDNDLPYDPELEIFCHDNYAVAKVRFEVMFQFRPDIDGVICTYAAQALAVWQILNDLGKKVPQDVALLSLEDAPSLAAHSQGIAAVHVDQRGIGRMAVQILGENHEQPVHREMPIIVNLRDTVKIK